MIAATIKIIRIKTPWLRFMNSGFKIPICDKRYTKIGISNTTPKDSNIALQKDTKLSIDIVAVTKSTYFLSFTYKPCAINIHAW